MYPDWLIHVTPAHHLYLIACYSSSYLLGSNLTDLSVPSILFFFFFYFRALAQASLKCVFLFFFFHQGNCYSFFRSYLISF